MKVCQHPALFSRLVVVVVVAWRGIVPAATTVCSLISYLNITPAKILVLKADNLYIHTHQHTYTHTHQHTYAHTNTHTYIHTQIHMHTHIYLYKHTHIDTNN